MKADHILGGWLWFTVCAVLSGGVLFLFGYWCQDSTNIPPPTLAITLSPRLLTGLSFMLCNPFSLVPLALILTASRFLVLKLSKLSSAVAALVGITFILLGAFWVPNPIVLWPFSILGEHTLPELIGKLFTFHIVPSPEVSYSSIAGFQSLFRWQLFECGARFCFLIVGWTACLVVIWKIDRRLRTTSTSLDR